MLCNAHSLEFLQRLKDCACSSTRIQSILKTILRVWRRRFSANYPFMCIHCFRPWEAGASNTTWVYCSRVSMRDCSVSAQSWQDDKVGLANKFCACLKPYLHHWTRRNTVSELQYFYFAIQLLSAMVHMMPYSLGSVVRVLLFESKRSQVCLSGMGRPTRLNLWKPNPRFSIRVAILACLLGSFRVAGIDIYLIVYKRGVDVWAGVLFVNISPPWLCLFQSQMSCTMFPPTANQSIFLFCTDSEFDKE